MHPSYGIQFIGVSRIPPQEGTIGLVFEHSLGFFNSNVTVVIAQFGQGDDGVKQATAT